MHIAYMGIGWVSRPMTIRLNSKISRENLEHVVVNGVQEKSSPSKIVYYKL